MSRLMNFSKVSATQSTYQHLESLRRYAVGYLFNQQPVTINTAEGPFPVGSGLSYYVNAIQIQYGY
jgi:hypothetical protein